MLKSSGRPRLLLHFVLAFVLVWPLVILFGGKHLVHYASMLNQRCEHRNLAVFNLMYAGIDPTRTTFIAGRREFIEHWKDPDRREILERRSGYENLAYLEIGKLTFENAAQLIDYLLERQAAAVVFESHPHMWTDFQSQGSTLQVDLYLLEAEFSIQRIQDTIRSIRRVLSRSCSGNQDVQLPGNIYSASYYMKYETVHTASKEALIRGAGQMPVFWVHETDYYANRLRGSPDTLESLRRLPRDYGGRVGNFILH